MRSPVCEHAFVSIKGGSYQRFRRALEIGNPTLVRAAAAELPRIGLEDALGICLVLLEAEPERVPAAAARMARARCRSTPARCADLDEARYVAIGRAVGALPERCLQAAVGRRSAASAALTGCPARRRWTLAPLAAAPCGYRRARDRFRIMGVVNVTPDSFSDGGEWFDARRRGRARRAS